VAIVKKRLKLELSLYSMLQVLSVSLFEKTSLFQLLSPKEQDEKKVNSSNQIKLFD
jgi:hypothetical protein